MTAAEQSKWFWDPETLKKIFYEPKPPKMKYIVTNDRDEFIIRLERITKMAFEKTGDNLRYLEGLDKIKQVKEGAVLEEVFPWVKELQDRG